MSEETPHRSIRSFVLRTGRVTGAQERAIATFAPRFIIPYAATLLDPKATFNRAAPTILEIGFGMGETTAAIAAEHPEHDYLGIEVHTPGIGALLIRIEALGLSNIRIIQHDAVEVLEAMIPLASLDGVHIFFPDPWPKKRHHKRRLLQARTVSLIADRLRPGGYLHVATDWEDYATQILDVLGAEPLLENMTGGFAERPASRPITKFENRGKRLGHGVWDILFARRDRI
ncbi:MAG: tRNA (guanosine(46)-N7)-methyltransferase TrmB [Burkholderiales bacterium]